VLVTGAAGFVGSHLIDLLLDEGQSVDAWYRPGTDTGPPREQPDRVRWRGVDILDAGAVSAALAENRPATVFHLAGAADVGSSWDQTYDTLATNVRGTHTLCEAVRHTGLAPTLLISGSAMVYGPSASALSEEAPLGPTNPYAVSKLAQEQLGARFAAEDGCRVVLPRAFNHIGIRQSPSFAAASFASRIASIEAAEVEPTIDVGNLQAKRDITDVRDTVRAYRALAERGASGRVYNVCSGHARSIQEVLDGLIALARVEVTVRVDPARIRPSDTPLVLGDPTRIESEIGWAPSVPFKQTLSDLLDHWRHATSVARS
jgi:GDP-4-dehydro-6-deoxy-D-mannose reductase|tara:strand:- start:291 stop:1241 length:951 start_codon:yes stop_codon:yes gene_type:complete